MDKSNSYKKHLFDQILHNWWDTTRWVRTNKLALETWIVDSQCTGRDGSLVPSQHLLLWRYNLKSHLGYFKVLLTCSFLFIKHTLHIFSNFPSQTLTQSRGTIRSRSPCAAARTWTAPTGGTGCCGGGKSRKHLCRVPADESETEETFLEAVKMQKVV